MWVETSFIPSLNLSNKACLAPDPVFSMSSMVAKTVLFTYKVGLTFEVITLYASGNIDSKFAL